MIPGAAVPGAPRRISRDKVGLRQPSESLNDAAGEEPAQKTQLKKLLGPYPAELMTLWPVDKRVGNVKNNDPSLIEPILAA
jgi:hypothetical protein